MIWFGAGEVAKMWPNPVELPPTWVPTLLSDNPLTYITSPTADLGRNTPPPKKKKTPTMYPTGDRQDPAQGAN